MKILITGYKGFIGSHMVKLLGDHDLTLYEQGQPFPRIKGHDWVIHLGAKTNTTDTDIDSIMTNNYDFSVQLLNQCIEYNVNFQFASSASVYGTDCRDFTETVPPRPKNYYAISKYMVERYCAKIPIEARERISIQCFRYFNVCGTGQDHKADMASPDFTFAKQYASTGRITLFENSDKYLRDFIPVELICRIHKDFFAVKESGIWNLGTGKTRSFLDVALDIAKPDKIDYIPMPEKLKESYQSYTCANTDKIVKSLNKVGKEFVL